MTEFQPQAVNLIVPARDEQENIAPLLAALSRTALGQVIVVDNGSRDRTGELARAGGAVVVTEPQRGYGAACLAGLEWIRQQNQSRVCPPPVAVAFIDADLADDPDQLPRLCQPILNGEADLVIGSRVNLADKGALDPHQRFGNTLACWLIYLTTGKRYRDLGPMRVVRWRSLEQLHMADRTWGWTVEMQFKAAKMGLGIVEMDVPYRRRRAGKSKISGSLIGSFGAGVKILSTIALLWWRRKF